MKTKEKSEKIELSNFKKKAIDLFAEKITDYVFLMIQNDRELMGEYLHVIEKNSSLKIVNSQIAQEVRLSFNLDLLNEKEKLPQSFLIQGHDKFIVKRNKVVIK